MNINMDMSGSINDVVDRFRKPVSQIMSIFTLLILLFSMFYIHTAAGYKYVPTYLKVVTGIEIIVIIVSFLQFFRFKSFDENFQINKVSLKNYVKFLTIINVISAFTPVFALSNFFYINAIQNYVNLYSYWLMGTISMIISIVLLVVGASFMIHRFPKIDKFVSGKTKTFIGLGLCFSSSFIYIEKIIEYILVPNVGDNKFLVLGSAILLFLFKVLAFEWIRYFSNFKVLILKED